MLDISVNSSGESKNQNDQGDQNADDDLFLLVSVFPSSVVVGSCPMALRCGTACAAVRVSAHGIQLLRLVSVALCGRLTLALTPSALSGAGTV